MAKADVQAEEDNHMLSIVIPYYNREDYLPHTLQTVASSSYRPLELILVDNGSTDRSAEICRNFADANRAEDFHITLAEEPKKGATYARNKGLSLCQTPFVYFFDSDDEFDEDFHRLVVPMLTDDIDLLALTFEMTVNGKTMIKRYLEDNTIRTQVLASHLATPSMVFRTEFLRSIGGWNPQVTLWDDWELGVRALSRHPRMRWYTDFAFHLINVHGDSITGEDFTSRIPDIKQTMKVVAEELGSQYYPPLYLRMQLIAGQLLREKNKEGAKTIRSYARQLLPGTPVVYRMLGALLRRYTGLGYRGAWRIACLLCPKG